MKKYISIFLSAILLFSLTACRRSQEIAFTVESTAAAVSEFPTEATLPVISELPTQTAAPSESFSFEALRCTDFTFASGAGAWGTRLVIEPDGSFSGTYSDHDNITGEGYPNGVYRWCDFTGQFSQPVQVNAYTYSMQLLNISYARQPGTEEIKEQILYCYTDAFGLENAEEFLIYLPGAPLAELPEEYQSWVGYYSLENTEETGLPFYGIYNVTQQQGFRSHNIVDAIREDVAYAELEDQSIDETLSNAATQADMNIAAQQKYELWDNVLNDLWAVLKRVLDEDAMRQLTNEELQWIDKKEQAVAEAGAEVEGGSLYPSVTGTKAAELTKERVYELLELLDSVSAAP